jgi:prepilin-type N-terminal cleavage/methylation domain-containing protein
VRADPRRRRGRRGQDGLTLVEMLVTIVLITVGVLGIADAIGGAERSAGIVQDQAKLEVAMRQLSDFVRSDLAAPNGLTYVFCATPGTYTLPAKPSGVASWVIPAGGIHESTAASRNGASLPNPTGQRACGSGVYDWGVQEITLRVTSTTGHTLTRTVWKADT